MKAAKLTTHPDFRLMRQTDVQSVWHMQMPEASRYGKPEDPATVQRKRNRNGCILKISVV